MQTFSKKFKKVGNVTFYFPDVRTSSKLITWNSMPQVFRLVIEAELPNKWYHGTARDITILGVPGSSECDVLYDLAPGYPEYEHFVDFYRARMTDHAGILQEADMKKIKAMINKSAEEQLEQINYSIYFVAGVVIVIILFSPILIPLAWLGGAILILYNIVKLIIWLVRNMFYAIRWPFLWLYGFIWPSKGMRLIQGSGGSKFVDSPYMGYKARYVYKQWVNFRWPKTKLYGRLYRLKRALKK